MSEAGEASENYTSQIDPIFAEAWNSVFSEEAGEEDSPASPEGTAAGEGALPDPAGVEPSGSTPGEVPGGQQGEPAPAIPTAGDLSGVKDNPLGGAPADPAAGAANPAGDTGGNPGAAYSFADVSPLLDAAATGINERAEAQFRAKALNDIRSEIDPKFLEALDMHPRLLRGESVPSVKGEGTEILRDAQDAADWQEAVKHIITTQVNQKTNEYLNDAKPFLSSVQESVEMFRGNPDLIPNSKEYNPELAKRFVQLAKSYEYRVDGKLIGYQVDVQPLITALRSQLPAAPAAPTARQDQAAQQARNDAGQFEAPQAGIPSRAGQGGTDEEDFGAFWGALGMKEMNI